MLHLTIKWRGFALAAFALVSLAPLVRGDPYGWINLDHRARPTGASAACLAYDEIRGELVLFGGATTEGFLRTWARRDGIWRPLPLPLQPPERFGAVMVYDAQRSEIVLFGGYGVNPEGSGSIALGDTWIWNGSAWRQVASPVSPSARAFPVMAYDGARKEVVLFGGIGVSETGEPLTRLGDTWIWNGNAWTRRTPAQSPSARNSAAGAFDQARGEMILFGGDDGGSDPRNDTWGWNGTSWSLRSPARAPTARTSIGMAYDPIRARIVLFAGVDQVLFHDTWTWDGQDWTEVTPPEQPEARFSPAMAFDQSLGQVVLFGGHRITYLGADTWGWNGATWASLEIPTPLPRIGGALTYDPVNARPLLFGGIADPIFGDTWQYANEWERKFPALSPQARCYAAITSDAARHEVVLFGGLSAEFSILNDTWIWNGANWRDASPGLTIPPSLSPSPRQNTAMTYDGARSETVLFGGWNTDVNQRLPDTWTWNGMAWQQKIATGPDPVSDHSMAYDAKRQQVLLYGGIDDFGQLRGETWTWNGTAWLQRSPPISPPPVANAVLVYDPTVERVLLFGGFGNEETALWAWDGTTWTRFDFGPGPNRRALSMMTFVPELGGSVLFGGLRAGYRDDTWLLRMPPLNVLGAVSRKTHAPGNSFEINLPLTGAPGIECRAGGASSSHEMLIRFVAPVTFSGASVTSGTGMVSSTAGHGTTQVSINLSNLPDAQTITLTLAGVNDGASPTYDLAVSLTVLAGDTNADARVNVGDTNQTKSRSGNLTNADNFRNDVNLDGRISVGDTNFVRARAGSSGRAGEVEN